MTIRSQAELRAALTKAQVRDVWRREQDKGISAGEKSMLSRARQILVSELVLAQSTTTDDADTRLLDALQAPTL